MRIKTSYFIRKNLPIFALAFVCLLISIFSGLYQDYAISQDEILQNEYGKKVISFYTSLFKDKSSFRYGDLYLYGGFYESIAVGFSKMQFTGEYESRHIINALFGVVGVLGVFKISRLFWNIRYSLLTSLTVYFYPTYFGHHFNNSKDIPFACLTIWSLYYIIRRYRSGFHKNSLLDWKLGIAIGLAMGIRVGGFIIYSYLLASLFLNIIKYYSYNRSMSFKTIGKSYGKIIFVSYFVMLLFWPWASSSPLTNPLKALKEIQSFSWFGSVLFDGSYIHVINNGLPWNYTIQYLSVKTPEILLIFFYIYLVSIPYILVNSIWGFFKQKDKINFKNTVQSINFLLSRSILKKGRIFIVLAFLLPIGFIIYRKAILYDEIRHIIFTIPFFVLMCYMGLEIFFNFIKSASPRLVHISFVVFIGFVFSLQAFHLGKYFVALHPHEADYFNFVSGGFEKNYYLYQTDSLRNSRKELIETLTKTVPESEGAIYIDFFENINNELDKMRAFVQLSGKDEIFLENFILENRKLKELHYLYFSNGRIKIAYGNEPVIYRIEFTNPLTPVDETFLKIGRLGKTFIHVKRLEK